MANTVENSPNVAGAASALSASRPRYTFTIPEAVRMLPGDPAVVVLRPITLAEEEQAQAVADGGRGQFAYEALKHSLVMADGVAITWENSGKERFLEGCCPNVRNLLLRAFGKLHVPANDDVASFLGSMTTTL